MLTGLFSRKRRRAAKGSALVIVLFFVVLLTIVTIAFLTRSMTAVKVSASSSGEAKSKILAASASDIIIGDYKQEIIAGSSRNTTIANWQAWPVYTPNSNLTAIPFQNGVPLAGTPATNAVPNMISRSVSPSNTSGSGPAVLYSAAPYSGLYTASAIPPNRAASDATASSESISATYPYTTTKVSSSYPSLNGRYISPAQWNSHYLIPRNTSVDSLGSTSSDSTPATTFVPPDWVVVTRGGANSVAWSSGSGGLNDPTRTNTNYAVGRYAYAVYNEGGLLDMNAAGYPADPNSPGATGSNGLTSTQISEKGSLALADLTQLASGWPSLTQAQAQTQINNFVGWRNYASAELSSANGSYGSFSFTSTTASNWLTNFVLGNTNGFMQIVPPAAGVTTPPTDQALLSRQQLISMTESLGMSPDFLQYMGTFSRALEQPSYAPNSSRPMIVGTSAPPAIGSENGYQGNNDGYGADNTLNPSFLSIRVASSGGWTRLNGATAVTGEPLVKTKFALKYLTWLTYQGPSALRSAVISNNASSIPGNSDYDIYQLENAYGISNAFLQQGTAANVLAYFGLTYSSTTHAWTYNHGITNSSGQTIIGTLALVAAAGRDPDFAELLKAAICAGSLGKAGPNLNVPGSTTNYQYTIDSAIDYQVLQIMVNLIDQQTVDSFPTRIEIAVPNQAGYYRSFFGVKDLPYFYRYHQFTVVDQLPVDTASDPTGTTCIGKAQSGIATGAVTTAGDCAYLMAPDVWNPHDPSALITSSSIRPTLFRLSATTDDPVSVTNPSQPVLTPVWKMGVSDGSQPALIYSNPTALSVANTAMTFSDANGTLFREPTLLWKPNLPAGSNLSAPSGTLTEANTSRQYCGIIGGKIPAEVVSGGLIYQATQINPNNNSIPTNAWQQITFMLEYQDPFGNWIPYDVKYPDLHGLYSPYAIINTTDYPNNSYQSPLQNGQIGDHASGFDPRSARFGVGTETSLGEVSAGTYGNSQTVSPANPYVLEPIAKSNFDTYSSTGYTALGGSGFTVLETQRPRADKCDQTNYSNPCMTSNPGQNVQMRWFSGAGFSASNGSATSPLEFDGLLSQNDPLVTFTARDNSTTAHLYFEDADGVNRRAMGAYVSQIAANTPLTDTTTSSLYVAGDLTRVGLPEATANAYSSNNGVGTATVQGQSRPIILNRPFRSVSDMSYAFRGTPWQNINFFTPESGDSALLDTFCINPPPSTAVVAGKVDLNTRQIPVLKAILSGAYRDELATYSNGPSYALPPITATEAGLIAAKLNGITTDTTDAWRGPFQNISGLVGRYVPSPGNTGSATDLQTFTEPVTSASYSYAGLSAALDSTVYTASMPSGVLAPVPYTIQRFREAGLRPLMDAGQVRVWNLLIDVVAQTGHYPPTATGLDQFVVEGQTRLWVHVAIDRYTGQVIDKQVEAVTP